MKEVFDLTEAHFFMLQKTLWFGKNYLIWRWSFDLQMELWFSYLFFFKKDKYFSQYVWNTHYIFFSIIKTVDDFLSFCKIHELFLDFFKFFLLRNCGFTKAFINKLVIISCCVKQPGWVRPSQLSENSKTVRHGGYGLSNIFFK